jgi:hypothetical protein
MQASLITKVRTKATVLLLAAGAICSSACERDVEREHMTEMKNWMDAICVCS